MFSLLQAALEANENEESSQLEALTPVCFKNGVGIHTGKLNEVRIFESPNEKEGIEFNSIFGNHLFNAPALWSRLSGTNRATALVMRSTGTRRKLQLSTIEHLLAVLHVFDLNKVMVNVQWENAAPGDPLEVPILDGSSLGWVEVLKDAKLAKRVSRKRKVWVAAKDFVLEDANKFVRMTPLEAPETQYDCHVSFPGGLEENSQYAINWIEPDSSKETFIKKIAPARTFGFKQEIDYLISKGLALGGSLDNALVIDNGRVINEGGYRVEQELASHKLLDAIGDFALLGAPLFARIQVSCAGHAMHLRALSEAVREKALRPALFDLDTHQISDF